jgi:hypothetical protein
MLLEALVGIEPAAWMKARKILILQTHKMLRNSKNTEPRYTMPGSDCL